MGNHLEDMARRYLETLEQRLVQRLVQTGVATGQSKTVSQFVLPLYPARLAPPPHMQAVVLQALQVAELRDRWDQALAESLLALVLALDSTRWGPFLP